MFANWQISGFDVNESCKSKPAASKSFVSLNIGLITKLVRENELFAFA